MSAKKRIISVFLSFAMVVGMCATTFAAESIPDVAEVTQADYMKEVEDTIKDYIRVSRMDTSDLSISQPILIHGGNDENDCAIFLFRGTQCVAYMVFTYFDNEYASSFFEGNYLEITDALNKKQNITLVSNEESIVLFTDDGCMVFEGNEDFAQEIVLSRAVANYEKQPLSLTPIAFSDEDVAYNTRSTTGKALNVQIIPNQENPDTGDYMCWAASFVSLIRYRTTAKNLIITDLYDSLKRAYPPSLYGYPKGTCTWEKRIPALYGLSCTHKSSGTNFSQIKSIIQSDKPVYTGLLRSGGGHAVVIAGFDSGYGKYYYKLMDPNKSNYVLVELPSSTATSFTYASGDYTYNVWDCHMY